MSRASELNEKLAEMKLIRTEQMQDALESAAGKVYKKVQAEAKKEVAALAKKLKVSPKDQVRTDKAGIKQLEMAVEIFVGELITQENEGGRADLNIDTE